MLGSVFDEEKDPDVSGGDTDVQLAEEEGASSRERLPESVGASPGVLLVWNFFNHAFLMPPRYFPKPPPRHSGGASSDGAGDTLAPSSMPLGARGSTALDGATAVAAPAPAEEPAGGGHVCGVPVCECEEASEPGGELLLALPSGGTAELAPFAATVSVGGAADIFGSVGGATSATEEDAEDVEGGAARGEALLTGRRRSSSALATTDERTV